MKKLLLSLIACFAVFVAFAKTNEVTFNFVSNTYGAGPAYTDANTRYVSTDNVATNGNVKVIFNGDSSSWRFWSDGIRAYKNKNASFTVETDKGVITEVAWTVKNGATFALKGTTENITSWTGSEESVSFVYTNTESNLALVTLTVTYEDGEVSSDEYALTIISPMGTILTTVTLGELPSEYTVTEGWLISGNSWYGSSNTFSIISNTEWNPSTITINTQRVQDEDIPTEVKEVINSQSIKYYNLSGVRVINPNKGIYIVRKGNQTTKELIK